MAEFNNKNTNKKPYAKSGNDNRRGDYNKKPNSFSGDKQNNRKDFKKDYSDSPKEFKKPYAGKKPVQQTPAPVRRPRGVEAPDFAGEVIEYKMSAALADTILKADKSKRPVQEVLCEYVNTQCGLKGYCVRVSYF